ncbi:hypothetical protein BDN70DRAFT_935883 [Pholiota conissans]|uniref:F-box domain-containing protein n=1 Tax=Pholiota conissans TaxID=109636 RepID=A0A9P5YUK5_9AGAR|nr:hypothetical protein BDN70DRAFT_935883 [Pholiota conissans]
MDYNISSIGDQLWPLSCNVEKACTEAMDCDVDLPESPSTLPHRLKSFPVSTLIPLLNSEVALPQNHDRLRITDLPAEILLEIFRHVGWKDILNIRQVSKCLLHFSTARPLWMDIFQRLSTELLASPILERPFYTYSAKELECIVFRRISSEDAFTVDRPRKTIAAHRPIASADGNEVFQLLQGGRWLLVTSPNPPMISGCVYAYNLEKLFPQEPQRIIDTGDRSSQPMPGWTIQDFRHSNDDPAHDEAENDVYPNPRMNDASANIHIYRLTLNGFGSDAILEAHKLKTIYAGLGFFNDNLVLRGHYLARFMYNASETVRRIEVCNWVVSSETSQAKSYIPQRPAHQSLSITPDGKLLVVTRKDIALYNIKNLHTMPPGKIAANAILRPYWHPEDLSILDWTSLVSKAYSDSRTGTTRISVAVKGKIYGLIIPNDTSDPWFGPLCASDLTKALRPYLGINKTINQGMCERKTTTFVRPGGNDKQNEGLLVPRVERSLVIPASAFGPPLFDEHSNRIFFAGYGTWCIIDHA